MHIWRFLAVMIYGVSVAGWWMAEISAMFLAAAMLVGLVARMSEEDFIHNFIDGARDLLGVALIIGIARGIVVVMDNGMITDTILNSAEQTVTGLSSVVFINVMFFLEILLSFLVPSTSGLAVLTMPIMAPLADFAGVGRDLVITAYQSASGLVNLITHFCCCYGRTSNCTYPIYPLDKVGRTTAGHTYHLLRYHDKYRCHTLKMLTRPSRLIRRLF